LNKGKRKAQEVFWRAQRYRFLEEAVLKKSNKASELNGGRGSTRKLATQFFKQERCQRRGKKTTKGAEQRGPNKRHRLKLFSKPGPIGERGKEGKIIPMKWQEAGGDSYKRGGKTVGTEDSARSASRRKSGEEERGTGRTREKEKKTKNSGYISFSPQDDARNSAALSRGT